LKLDVCNQVKCPDYQWMEEVFISFWQEVSVVYTVYWVKSPVVQLSCFLDFVLTSYMKAVWKVRGLILLLQVGTLWRCSDSLFSEVPYLASDAFLTMPHPLLKNVLQTVGHFEVSCLRAPFSWLEKPRNWTGRDLNWILCSAWIKWIGRTPLERVPYSPDLAPCDFFTLPSMKRELWGKKFQSDQWSAACF
jgi:hypothetical protein